MLTEGNNIMNHSHISLSKDEYSVQLYKYGLKTKFDHICIYIYMHLSAVSKELCYIIKVCLPSVTFNSVAWPLSQTHIHTQTPTETNTHTHRHTHTLHFSPVHRTH